MTDNQHITRDEWVGFYTLKQDSAQWAALHQAIAEHIKTCLPCYALYQKGQALWQAGQRLARAENTPKRQDAYQEVASGEPKTGQKALEQGLLYVSIDYLDENPHFMEDTIETSGLANQYDLYAENGGQTLMDDGRALQLKLHGSHLSIQQTPPQGVCRYQLLCESGETLKGRLDAEGAAEIPLPPRQFLTLELLFTLPDGRQNQ